MPLKDFVDEAVTLWETQPDATAIQAKRVKFLRCGQARGDYDEVVATLNASPASGRVSRTSPGQAAALLPKLS
ncbi:hypothetical protein HNP40_001464 [Mycobacteroides chelonae]|nr:hypothetical protein [Mycobacteroides chelonae]